MMNDAKFVMDIACDLFWCVAAIYFIAAVSVIKATVERCEADEDEDEADWWKKNNRN